MTPAGPWATASIVLGPVLALIYSVSVWVTYALAKECSWTDSTLIQSLSMRSSLIVAACACALGLGGKVEGHDTKREGPTLIISCLIFNALAAAAIRQTRTRDVVGCESPIATNAKAERRGEKPPFSWVRGKTVLITGANTGIGKETAAQLAFLGAGTILLACRSKVKALAAIDDIKRETRNAGSKTNLLFLPLDLGSFASIRDAVRSLDSDLRLDVIICNAGVMMSKKTKSSDGYELTMQANHLGHFLLTTLLLPKLREGSSRVLTLTSSTYALVDRFDFDDMFCDSTRPYTLFGQYGMSKLANILFAKELARRYGVLSFAVHPGIVRTDVARNMAPWVRISHKLFDLCVATVQKTGPQGAYSSVTCAAGEPESLPPNGSYIYNCRAVPVLPAAESEEDAKRLWEISERLVEVRKK